MVQKIPPPPTLSREYQQLNRWLIEIQSILNSTGGIDPDQILGLPALFLQVAANTANITTLQGQVAANATAIAAANINIAANAAAITAANLNITALLARPQIRNGIGAPGAGLGNSGDLYIDNTTGPPVLYGKIGAVWVGFV